MARPLNKRQRKEVRGLIRAAISPEWKVLELKQALAPVDLESSGAGIKLFDNITQGVGASNRIGDTIRVKRIDCWFFAAKPQAPSRPSPCGLQAILYRRESDESVETKTMAAHFDQTIGIGNFIDGAYPKKRDLQIGGSHIKWMKRMRLRGLPLAYDHYYEFELLGVPAVDPAVFRVPLVNTTGAGAQSIPAHAVGWSVPHIKDADIGRDFVQFYKRWTWGGAGLKVQYQDLLFAGSREKNQMYLQVASQSASGEAALNGGVTCPRYGFTMRIYFVDD